MTDDLANQSTHLFMMTVLIMLETISLMSHLRSPFPTAIQQTLH